MATPAIEGVKAAAALSETVLRMAREHLRRVHPGVSEAELDALLDAHIADLRTHDLRDGEFRPRPVVR